MVDFIPDPDSVETMQLLEEACASGSVMEALPLRIMRFLNNHGLKIVRAGGNAHAAAMREDKLRGEVRQAQKGLVAVRLQLEECENFIRKTARPTPGGGQHYPAAVPTYLLQKWTGDGVDQPATAAEEPDPIRPREPLRYEKVGEGSSGSATGRIETVPVGTLNEAMGYNTGIGSSIEKSRVDAYLETVERMEPNIHPVDLPAAAASIAISLKRIADALQNSGRWLTQADAAALALAGRAGGSIGAQLDGRN